KREYVQAKALREKAFQIERTKPRESFRRETPPPLRKIAFPSRAPAESDQRPWTPRNQIGNRDDGFLQARKPIYECRRTPSIRMWLARRRSPRGAGVSKKHAVAVAEKPFAIAPHAHPIVTHPVKQNHGVPISRSWLYKPAAQNSSISACNTYVF